MMQVIILTGMPGSGKTAAREVAEKIGIPVFRMGQYVWDEARAQGLPLTDKDVGTLATRMRELHGPDIWANRTIEEVRKAPPAPLIIIDGCRSKAEHERFRQEFGDDMVIVAVRAPIESRFTRLKGPGRPDDIRTIEELKERDKRELAWGLDGMISAADLTIDNEGTKEDLHEAMVELLKKIGP